MTGWTLHGWWLVAALWAAFNAGVLVGVWLLRELRLARRATTLVPPATASGTNITWTWPNDPPPSASAFVTADPIVPGPPPLQVVVDSQTGLRVVR